MGKPTGKPKPKHKPLKPGEKVGCPKAYLESNELKDDQASLERVVFVFVFVARNRHHIRGHEVCCETCGNRCQ